MSKGKAKYLPVLLLPIIIVLVLGAWLVREPLLAWDHIQSDTAVFDLREVDFDNSIATISRTVEYVPGVFLTPQEFAQRDDIVVGEVPEETELCTMRIRFLVPDGQQYGICGYSVNYASSVYVNGKWLFDEGVPAATIEAEEAGDIFRLFSAEPQDGVIEILVQTSAFANMDSSAGMAWLVSNYENVRIYTIRSSAIDTVVMAWYLLLAIISLLLFCVLPSYRANGWLTLLALDWALRTGVKNTRILHSLFPYFSWPVSFKIEIITSIVTIIFLVQILHHVFPGALPRWLRVALNGGTAAGILYVLVRPWYSFFGQGSVTNQILYLALAVLFVFILLSLRKKRFDFSQWIVVLGLGLALFAFVWDANWFAGSSILPYAISQPTLVIFTLFMLVSAMIATMEKSVRREVELAQIVDNQKLEVMDARIAMMLSQIQPHFLYNSLTAIMKLCDIDAAQAKLAVGNFSHYLRGNLDSLKEKRLISFRDELDHVEAFLTLEQLRLGDGLRVEYDLLAEDFLLPPLTLQPIVENAVEHGLAEGAGVGTLKISTEAEPELVRIIVSDDGLGFDPDGAQADGRTHIGIENVRYRLAAICGGTLEITSTPDQGTTVTITLPQGEGEEEGS